MMIMKYFDLFNPLNILMRYLDSVMHMLIISLHVWLAIIVTVVILDIQQVMKIWIDSPILSTVKRIGLPLKFAMKLTWIDVLICWNVLSRYFIFAYDYILLLIENFEDGVFRVDLLTFKLFMGIKFSFFI